MTAKNNVKIDKSAVVCGNVSLGENVNIWCCAVVRGDQDKIIVGDNSNIQDNAVVHCTKNSPCIIGEYCTIGHGAIVHGCTIKNNVIVGMGSIILDGAVIEDNCTIGAGAVIPKNKIIPRNSVVVGNPYKILKTMTEEEGLQNKKNALEYLEYAKNL